MLLELEGCFEVFTVFPFDLFYLFFVTAFVLWKSFLQNFGVFSNHQASNVDILNVFKLTSFRYTLSDTLRSFVKRHGNAT